MPLSPTLAHWLRGQGHDAVHAADLGMGRSTDSEIMERAIAEARTIITADLDYPRLLARTGATGPSLILFRGGNWSEAEAIDRMRNALAGLTDDEITRSILVIDRDRIRRRRLPVG
jgi:predicted nuclease of predicted toxin-antitoxin system